MTAGYSDSFAVFDVETPNSANDRISAIGISLIDGGEITESFYTEVDPEAHFDSFNIMLTGITPESVSGMPSFPQLWETVYPMMKDRILVAHNAPFDMSVLSKCMRHYGIDNMPTASYICTCRMGRKCYPYLPNHKLNTMCDYLHLELDHHNAGSDSTACALLLLNYMEKGLSPRDFVKNYDLLGTHSLTK